MVQLQFSKYNIKVEEREGVRYVFDEFRRKQVILTPEEWVRQHILHYLVYDRQYPASLIAVERGIELNGLKKRFDIVVFNRSGQAKMIIECKAPGEVLNQKVFEQIAGYNLALNAAYLWVTNGTFNYCCKLARPIQMLDTIPEYNMLNED